MVTIKQITIKTKQRTILPIVQDAIIRICVLEISFEVVTVTLDEEVATIVEELVLCIVKVYEIFPGD